MPIVVTAGPSGAKSEPVPAGTHHAVCYGIVDLGTQVSEKYGPKRKLALLWGVHWVLTHDISTFTEMVQTATEAARTEGIADQGQRLVITAGVPFGTPGATNVLRIARVGE